MPLTKLKLFFVIAVVFVAGVWWVQNTQFLAIDRCLDAGGYWSYEQSRCAD
ncbi:MAG: hypothetical protein AB8B60_04850 [Sulfitobacter sp.]